MVQSPDWCTVGVENTTNQVQIWTDCAKLAPWNLACCLIFQRQPYRKLHRVVQRLRARNGVRSQGPNLGYVHRQLCDLAFFYN